MDCACAGSRGASFTERSLAPKKIDQAQSLKTPYLQVPGPRPFFRESSRDASPRRGARPPGRAGGALRAARPCPSPEARIPPLSPKQEQAHWVVLGISRRHRREGLAKGVDVTFAGDERGSAGSRISQVALNP